MNNPFPYVFISYQTSDKQCAGKIQEFLEGQGIKSFLAHEDIEVSIPWRGKILEELRQADIFICLISKNYHESHWCLQESGIAAFLELHIISLSLDGSVPGGFIGAIQGGLVDAELLNVDDLVKGLEAYDAASSTTRENYTDTITSHEEIPSTHKPSTFFGSGESLGVVNDYQDGEVNLVVADNQHLFLRLIPTHSSPTLSSAKAARDCIQHGNLRLITRGSPGGQSTRNKWGAFVFNREDGRLTVTQLFLNNELWGINTYLLDEGALKNRAGTDFGFFACPVIEEVFIHTLANFLTFAEKTLTLEPPLKLVAGVTGVEGYRMGANFGGFEKFRGRCINPDVVYEGTVLSYETKAADALRPFFEKIWEECGLERPDRELL